MSSTAPSLALKYDVFNDFEPVALIVHSPMLMTANKAIPAKDLKELIAWLKANPDKASQGAPGIAGAAHLAGVFFQTSDGHTLSDRALSRCRSGNPRHDCGSRRPDVRLGRQLSAACARRQHQGPCHPRQAVGLASLPISRRWTRPGSPGFYVSSWQAIWVPKGTSRRCDSQAEFSSSGCSGRCRGAPATHRSGAGHSSARGADARRGRARGWN